MEEPPPHSEQPLEAVVAVAPGRRSLAALTDSERDRAMARYAVLRPHLEEGTSLTRSAVEADVPLRTARRWLATYRREGLAGLARSPRSDRGQRRTPSALVAVIEEMVLRRPPPSIASVYRKACQVAESHQWPAPAYTTVHTIAKALDPALLALAQEGDKAYRQTFDLVHRSRAERPNAIWQVDHTELDLLVLDPPGPPARLWLTVIMDDHSRAIPGYTLNLSAPSALQTALALHQAIWRKADPGWHVCGIPEVLYVDHGTGFTSRHIEQVSIDLRIGLVHSIPGQPRGRGKVERYFVLLNQLFLPGLPGHLVGGTLAAPPGLTLAQLDATLQRFIVAEYHLRPHPETGLPPQECWEGGAFLPRMPDSLTSGSHTQISGRAWSRG